MQALVPRLVPAAQIARAVTLSLSAFQTASIVGPALGGVLYAHGAPMAYASCSLLFLGASAFISMIRISRTPS